MAFADKITALNTKIPFVCRERNIVDQVNKIAPRFQEGLKAFSDSPIIGEVPFDLRFW